MKYIAILSILILCFSCNGPKSSSYWDNKYEIHWAKYKALEEAFHMCHDFDDRCNILKRELEYYDSMCNDAKKSIE